jgi:hypothetical protein
LFLTSLSSDARDATFLLKLNFFSVRSFNRGSKSGEDVEHGLAALSETDIAPSAEPNRVESLHPRGQNADPGTLFYFLQEQAGWIPGSIL